MPEGYDQVSHCPICRDKTPHGVIIMGMDGGVVCLVCGMIRSEVYKGTFVRCDSCMGYKRVRPMGAIDATGQLVSKDPPEHKCKSWYYF